MRKAKQQSSKDRTLKDKETDLHQRCCSKGDRKSSQRRRRELRESQGREKQRGRAGAL